MAQQSRCHFPRQNKARLEARAQQSKALEQFCHKRRKMRRAKVCSDRTVASGSPSASLFRLDAAKHDRGAAEQAWVPFCNTNQFPLQNNIQSETGRSVFGLHRQWRITFLSFAVPWCSKERPGHETTPVYHFVEKGSHKGQLKVKVSFGSHRCERIACWWSYGNHAQLKCKSQGTKFVKGQSLFN